MTWLKKALPIVLLLLFGLLQGCSKQEKLSRSLQSADRFFAEGNFAAAEIELKNALEIDPSNPQAYRTLGFIFAARGNFMDAAQLLHQSKSNFPQDDELQIKFAECLLKLAYVPDCRKELKELLARSPENQDAYILLAESALSPDLMEETQTILSESKNPDNVEIKLASALINLRQGLTETGRTQLGEVIAADPENPHALSLLTNLHIADGKMEEALASSKKASELAGGRSDESIAYVTLLMNQEKIDEAIAELERITSETPDYLPAWRTLGLVELTRGDQAAASKYFDKVLASNSLDLQAAIQRAQIHIENDEAKKAIDLLNPIMRAFPPSAPVDFTLARAYLASDEINRAASALDRVLAEAPGTPDAASLRARIYLQDEQTFRGISLLEKVLEQNPENLEARDLLVQAYRASDQANKAIALLEEDIPGLEQPERRIDLSMLLASQGRADEAYSILELSTSLFPDNLALAAQLASLDLARKRPEAAAKRIDAYIEKHPESAEAVVFRAGLALNEEDLELAERLLKSALELEADSAPAFSLLLRVKTLKKQDEEALAVLDQYLGHYPDDHKAILELSNVQQRLGKNEDAVTTLKKIIQAQPDFAAAYNNLAEIESEVLGNLDSAVEYARKARSLDDRRPEIADTLGWIEWKLGNYPKALSLLSQAAVGIATNPSILYHKGRAHYSLGDADDARRAFARALSTNEDFPGKEEATRLLNLLNEGFEASVAELSKRVSSSPDDVIFRMQLAASQVREGQPEQALETYRKAFELSPSLANALAGQSELYAGPLSNPQLALETAEKARKISPRSPRVMAALGHACFLTGSYQESYGLLKDASTRLTDVDDVRFNLARSAYSLGRIAEARQIMQQIASLKTVQAEHAKVFLALTDPDAKQNPDINAIISEALSNEINRVPALMLRGSLEIARSQDAESTYLEVLKLHPELNQARVRLAAIYLADPSKLEQARLMATEAREDLADDPELTSILASISYRKGEYDYAIQLLDTLATVRKLLPTELYLLGMSQFRSGKMDAANNLRDALAVGLPDSDATEAKKAIQAIESPGPDSK